MMVDRQLGRINSLFKLAQGRDIVMRSFEDRLVFQKTMYLLSAIGIGGLPKQTWYVKGPYSFHLATTGFKVHEQEQKPVAEVPSDEKEKVSNLKEHFEYEMANFSEIELLVSAVYVFSEEGIFDMDKAAEWIRSKKPWYSVEEIKQMLHKVWENRTLFNF